MVNIVQATTSLQKYYWGSNENPEILKFVLDHLKTKEICKHGLKQNVFCNKICSSSI